MSLIVLSGLYYREKRQHDAAALHKLGERLDGYVLHPTDRRR
jgi:hypothetical protein